MQSDGRGGSWEYNLGGTVGDGIGGGGGGVEGAVKGTAWSFTAQTFPRNKSLQVQAITSNLLLREKNKSLRMLIQSICCGVQNI